MTATDVLGLREANRDGDHILADSEGNVIQFRETRT
jgi:hypothetical protein